VIDSFLHSIPLLLHSILFCSAVSFLLVIAVITRGRSLDAASEARDRRIGRARAKGDSVSWDGTLDRVI
jgi:hypothetical protein